VDEFLAAFSIKTLEYIRTPEEHTFCPPFNLIKIFIIFPIAPFLTKPAYHRLNEILTIIVFFPTLCLIAFYESQYYCHTNSSNNRILARHLSKCHLVGLSDGEISSGWDIEDEFDPSTGWEDRVKTTIPHIEEDQMHLLHRLEREIKSTKEAIWAKNSGLGTSAAFDFSHGDQQDNRR
jgi:hypothetical protein